jgi:hypothetical protein
MTLSLRRTWIPATLLALIAACSSKDTTPAAAGEACNFDAPNSDGCDATSVCLSGVCHKQCASASDCGGGQCATYTRAAGDQYQACENPTGAGGGGSSASTSGAGASGGSSNCSTSCQSTCTGSVPEQACLYCQAACLCRCSGDTQCAQQNSQSARALGTTC